MVALAPRPDLLDLAVGLGLLDGEVVDHDARVAHLVGDLGALGFQRRDLGELGEVRALVPELRGPRVELGDVEPMTQPYTLVNVLREDLVAPGLDRDEVLAAAPDAVDGRFRVPPIIGLAE